MANPPRGKTRAPVGIAKKAATRGGKASTTHAEANPVDPGQKYVVFGMVTLADKTPAAGFTVIAHDNDESGENLLGQAAMTDERGNYKISYSDADFRRTKNERGGADVIVCVYDASQELLFTSKKRNNAPESTGAIYLGVTSPMCPSCTGGMWSVRALRPNLGLITDTPWSVPNVTGGVGGGGSSLFMPRPDDAPPVVPVLECRVTF